MTLVISFIIVLVIINNLSKSESSVLLPYASVTSVKPAFAVEASNSSSTTNNKLVNELVEKGIILFKTGDYQEAIKIFDKALSIDGNNVRAMNNKGVR